VLSLDQGIRHWHSDLSKIIVPRPRQRQRQQWNLGPIENGETRKQALNHLQKNNNDRASTFTHTRTGRGTTNITGDAAARVRANNGGVRPVVCRDCAECPKSHDVRNCKDSPTIMVTSNHIRVAVLFWTAMVTIFLILLPEL
jgi:hypothetical protein